MSASFKAGQQVTVNNLRSLNDKLREAQKALDNANENIDRTDQTQDKMDEAKDEVNQLLSTGLWEKLWNDTISPFQFYAGKYAEDTSNEAMAGEPGYPVQNIGEVISAPPIPRLQYWDPFAKFGWFRIVATSTDEFAYLCKDYNFASVILRSKGEVSDVLRQMTVELTLLGTLLGLLIAFNTLVYSAPVMPGMKLALSYTLIGLCSLFIVMVTMMQGTLLYLVDSAEIHNFSGYNISNWVSSPTCYHAGDINIRGYLVDRGMFSTFLAVSINAGLLIGLASTAIGLEAGSKPFLSNPFTIAIGMTMSAVSGGLINTFNWLFATSVTASVVVQFEMFMNTCFLRYLDRADSDYAYREESSKGGFLSSLIGLDEKAGLDNLGFLRVMNAITTLGIVEIISAASTGTAQKKDSFWDPNAYFDYHLQNRTNNKMHLKVNKNDTGILTPFDGWWSSPIINVNINDIADGTLVGGPIQQPTFLGRVDHKTEIRSQVFRGDYFGAQKGIKLLEGRTITNTVVVRVKQTANNYTYYACGVLVTTSNTGNQLHLLWERNAIYDFGNTSMPHVEQMIYNYEPSALPVKDFFTSNRTGRLQYIYGKFRTGKGESTFQLRNVQRAWPNYLNGQLINTEYTFGPMTIMTSGPRCSWGDLSSYMYL